MTHEDVTPFPFLRCKPGLSLMAVVAGLLLLCAVPCRADDPKPPAAQKAPAAAPPEVIPIAEVATRAMAVTELLNAISAKFASILNLRRSKNHFLKSAQT